FRNVHRGAIPGNFFRIANTDSNSRYLRRCRELGLKPHSARFPKQIPDFFIRFLTDPGDTVLDPFAGSNMTGWVAESRKRRWIACEVERPDLEALRLVWPWNQSSGNPRIERLGIARVGG